MLLQLVDEVEEKEGEHHVRPNPGQVPIGTILTQRLTVVGQHFLVIRIRVSALHAAR